METSAPKLTRVLGVLDLTLLLVVAVVNLNLVPVVAAGGVSVLSLWVLAFLLFFIPQAVAVVELSTRYPEEGGVYVWTREAFGDGHAFMSGWCYWTNNVFYIPTLLLYLVGFSAYVGGERTLALADNDYYVVPVSLALLWIVVVLAIRGLGVGKWVQNAGAVGAFVTAAVIVAIACVAFASHGMANEITLSALVPSADDWQTASMLGTVCFAFIGLELGSVMGDEIKDPRRSVPRAVVVAGVCCAALYLLSTFALQATLPVEDIGVIKGLLQAVDRVAADAHLEGVVAPLALLLSVSIFGTTCAWVAGVARVPFVIGIERYLPAAFAKTHPRYNTPHVALLLQGVSSTVFILINSIGSSVKDVYLVLLSTAVVINLVPFLYMFAALVRVRRTRPRAGGYFARSWPCYLAGVFGFAVTALGIVLQFVPPPGVEDVRNYEIKTVLGTVTFVVPAVAIYWAAARKRRLEPLAVAAVGETPD
jgi:amino acid transporter